MPKKNETVLPGIARGLRATDGPKSSEPETRQRAILELAFDAVVETDAEGVVTGWDPRAEKIFGWTASDIMGRGLFEAVVPPGYLEGHQQAFRDLLASGKDLAVSDRMEAKVLHRDGRKQFIEVILWASRLGENPRVTILIRNITAQKKLEKSLRISEERTQLLLDRIEDGCFEVELSDEGRYLFVNNAFCRITGYSAAELVGKSFRNFYDAESARQLNLAYRKVYETGQPLKALEHALVRKDGTTRYVEESVSLKIDSHGRPVAFVGIRRDCTERKHAERLLRSREAQMAHSAEHDFLTGLPNRMLLNDRVDQAIALAPRHGKTVAVLFLDLDGFKHINDSLGHPVGDKLLQCIAKRLVGCVRATDTVSRQGGDEFVVLLSEMEHSEDAAITARRMLKAVAELHSIEQHDLHITTSIGLSVYPDDGKDAETLIKNADTAMYQAKDNGRQSYQFFKPEMNIRAVDRQSIEESLRRALQLQEFTLHYQPKVNLKTGEITGAEALIRWTHPTRGPVPPAQFIPVAEDCGLILPISKWVLREACKQARAWVDAGLPLLTMGVNISAMEFRNENFLEGVFAILKETGWEPRSLELELTESVLMKHAESAASVLQTLRARGVQVAIDDFGTGYSSLSYLRKFPIDALKIDQSFVRQISATLEDAAIVTAVISMGRSLRLRVVAEGVETQEELAFLQAHQCDEAQGYYFSRPVDAHQFSKLLKTGIAEILVH
jgi:diguanylate cyclase (GGDEF)-like protein/PAS domain S-box-containing protein